MDIEQAKSLRKPFEAQQIGKLPKPYSAQSPKSNCPQCHGYHGMPAAHLDYVGHAATTDRLLQVDPDWNWEPFAYDMSGLPMLDGNRNLWIKLTVCGVTRIGVGDGKSLKEVIGDAIRNAAMRFGVALDLWAKEDLQGMEDERGTEPDATKTVAPQATRTMSRKPAASKAAVPPPSEPEPDDGWTPPVDNSNEPLSPAQLTKLHVCFGEAKIGRDEALKWLTTLTGREITTSKDLTRDEANKAINVLEADRLASERPAS